MELICPSCEARYAIPDGSIGEKGRQVSCMNCGHGWHAYPPLVLGAEEAAVSPAAGMQWRDPEAMPSPPTALPARPSIPGMTDAAPAAAAPAKSRSAVNRSEQLAEIREMLAEVQSEDRAAAARSDQRAPMQSEPTLVAPAAGFAAAMDDRPSSSTTPNTFRDATRAAPEQPEAPGGDYDASLPEDDDDDDVDPLRRRMEMHDTSNKTSARPTDVKRLRRTHERRAKRRMRQGTAGSGAFLTGFLLVAIIASVMISLYLLHPQIIARVPATEKPLTEYVATIDGLRVTVAETFEGVHGWVSQQLEGKV